MQKVEFFRNKKFLIVHGTADGNHQTLVFVSFHVRILIDSVDSTTLIFCIAELRRIH